MNQEGMDDRYYFSDWGECLCEVGEVPNPRCPFYDEHAEEMEAEDE